MDDFELRKVGLKVTLPRVKILKILDQADPHHISVEDIHRQLIRSGEDIGLATVYRVLTQFETAGLVKRHNFVGGQAVFELDQGEHHDHMVCVNCGTVQEFFDEMIEQRQEAIVRQAQFTMTDHNLTIYGLCKKCDEKVI